MGLVNILAPIPNRKCGKRKDCANMIDLKGINITIYPFILGHHVVDIENKYRRFKPQTKLRE